MTTLHPYRYPQAFLSQLERLERLYPGITAAKSSHRSFGIPLEAEHTGATRLELARRHRRLQHLESLIMDWRVDGEHAFSAPALDTAQTECPPSIEFEDVPPPVSYVTFEASSAPSLASISGGCIEGFYVREIVRGGKFTAELTFVCNEPGWRTMDSCTYADAMGVGARIGVSMVPLGAKVSLASAIRLFEGDRVLIDDPAAQRAISFAAAFTASAAWKGPRTQLAPPRLCL